MHGLKQNLFLRKEKVKFLSDTNILVSIFWYQYFGSIFGTFQNSVITEENTMIYSFYLKRTGF